MKNVIELLAKFLSANNSILKQTFIDELETAISALEKQIPKKLKTTEVGRFGLVFLCPSCENEVAMIWESVWQKGRYKQKYCHYCGQALDWSDNNA